MSAGGRDLFFSRFWPQYSRVYCVPSYVATDFRHGIINLRKTSRCFVGPYPGTKAENPICGIDFPLNCVKNTTKTSFPWTCEYPASFQSKEVRCATASTPVTGMVPTRSITPFYDSVIRYAILLRGTRIERLGMI